MFKCTFKYMTSTNIQNTLKEAGLTNKNYNINLNPKNAI